MPSMHNKKGGSWDQLQRGEAFLNQGGTVEQVDNIYLKDGGVWYPMFEIIALSRWGYAGYAGPGLNQGGYTGPQNFIDTVCTTLLPNNDEDVTFSITRPDANTNAYFAHPKILGIAQFTDLANGFPGGWDGVSFSDTVGGDWSNISSTGPVEVTYDDGNGDEQWYVYRTDWQGPDSPALNWKMNWPSRPANS